MKHALYSNYINVPGDPVFHSERVDYILFYKELKY